MRIMMILCHSLIHYYVSYFPVTWMITFPSSLKLLSSPYDKAKESYTRNLIQEGNRSGIKLLLNIEELHSLSYASFTILHLHCNIPEFHRSTSSFVCDQSSYELYNSQNIPIRRAQITRSDLSPVFGCYTKCNTL